jgi:hypothetical protein
LGSNSYGIIKSRANENNNHSNTWGKAETARELCYRLYTLCERKKRAAEALSYNGLANPGRK